jgi:hypothetical protein
VTDIYTKGTRLKWTQTTVKYGVVLSSSYSSPNTTVTIVVNTDYVVTNAAISATYYSRINTPLGWPGWFNYSGNPTSGATVGNGTVEASYNIDGSICNAVYKFTLGSTSAISGDFIFPIPVTVVLEGNKNALIVDVGSAAYAGELSLLSTSGYVRVMLASGTYVSTSTTLSATVPHTWAVNDNLRASTWYKF